MPLKIPPVGMTNGRVSFEKKEKMLEDKCMAKKSIDKKSR
jgi:hypothetical protein